VLPQRVDGRERLQRGIERVDAVFRRSRCVGGKAEELDGELPAGEAVLPQDGSGGRVEHHGGVDPVEHPGVGEDDLPAAALLGRRSDQ